MKIKKLPNLILVSLLLILSMFATIFCGCTVEMGKLYADVKYKNEELYTVGGGEIAQDVKNIEVFWQGESVHLSNHDGKNIIVTEQADVNEIPQNLQLRYVVKGDTLTVQFATNGRHDIRELNKRIEVQIPKALTLDKITLTNISGKTTSSVHTLNAKITAIDSNIIISGVAQNLSISSVSGNVSVNAENLLSANIESVSGNVLLTARGVKSAEISTVSGKVELQLPVTMGFVATFESVSGKFESSLEVDIADNAYTRLNGDAKINIKSVSGDFKISEYGG